MKIKRSRQLQPGDVIKWTVTIESMEDWQKVGRHCNDKQIECVCTQVFSHHAMFRMLEHPFREFSISNTKLYQAGIYTENDAVNVFARKQGD